MMLVTKFYVQLNFIQPVFRIRFTLDYILKHVASFNARKFPTVSPNFVIGISELQNWDLNVEGWKVMSERQ